MNKNKIYKMARILFYAGIKAFNTIAFLLNHKHRISVFWFTDVENNWGDALNPVLIKSMTGKKAVLYNTIFNLTDMDVYWVIGSILGNFSDKNMVVWGSGVISAEIMLDVKPKQIYAVRGPLTRELLLSQGIECPDIYGDPAMLYPYYYKPKIEGKYKLGIIPHYFDYDSPLLDKFRHNHDIFIINILDDINKVVDNICSCERIASSSLHGIIASDAYGIPSVWIEISDKVIGKGFKFYDYFEAVGRKDETCLCINENTNLGDIYLHFKEYYIDLDLSALVEVCPFMTSSQKESLKARIRGNGLNISKGMVE